MQYEDEEINEDYYQEFKEQYEELYGENTNYQRVKRDKDFKSIREGQYDNYLKSSKWKNIRQRILERDNYNCKDCGKSKSEEEDVKLEVHHMFYPKVLGEEDDSHLITLCHSCHKKRSESFIDLTLMDPYYIVDDKGNDQIELTIKNVDGNTRATVQITQGGEEIKKLVKKTEELFQKQQKITTKKYCVERNVSRGRIKKDLIKVHVGFNEWDNYLTYFIKWLKENKEVGDIVTNFEFKALFPKKESVDLIIMDYLVCKGYLERIMQTEFCKETNRDKLITHFFRPKKDRLTNKTELNKDGLPILTKQMGVSYKVKSLEENVICPFLERKDTTISRKCQSCNRTYNLDVIYCNNKECENSKTKVMQNIKICKLDYEYGVNYNIFDQQNFKLDNQNVIYSKRK